MKISFPPCLGWMALLLSLALAPGAMAQDTNIALTGTGIFGVNSGDTSVLGVPYGQTDANNSIPFTDATFLNDGNVNYPSQSSTWGNPGGLPDSYAGIVFGENVTIDNVIFYGATFQDGGWFGQNGYSSDNQFGAINGNPYVAAALVVPQLQSTTDGGVTWTDISPSGYTDDYIGQLTGLTPGSHYQTTFTLDSTLTDIDGIRLIGTTGGAGSGGNGFLGANEMEVNGTVVPEPSTWAMMAAGVTSLLLFRRRRSS